MEVNTGTFRPVRPEWEHRGYCGFGEVSGLLDSLRGRTALVCGNGRGVFQELDQALTLVEAPVIFAANDVGMYLPRLDHWVSLHATKLPHWVGIRTDAFCKGPGNRDFKVHAHWQRPPSEVDYNWQGLTPVMALSGYFALQIAYLMGCELIILCGCPGDATPRFWEMKCENEAYVNGQEQISQEMAYKPEFKKVVRSVSGWTREFFGVP